MHRCSFCPRIVIILRGFAHLQACMWQQHMGGTASKGFASGCVQGVGAQPWEGAVGRKGLKIWYAIVQIMVLRVCAWVYALLYILQFSRSLPHHI